MSRRINVRRDRGGGGGGSGGGSALNYQTVLGLNLIAGWHSQRFVTEPVGGEAGTWTDFVGGRVISAPTAGQRPIYAADGALFGGKRVIQTAVAANRCLYGSGLSLPALGARPWFFLRERSRVAAAGISTNLGSNTDAFFSTLETATNFNLQTTFTGTTVGPLKDTNVHSQNFGLDGVNQVYTIDAGTTTVAAAGGIGGPTNPDRVAIGCIGWDAAGTNQTCNHSIAIYLICQAQPSAAQIAAIMAMMNAEFP